MIEEIYPNSRIQVICRMIWLVNIRRTIEVKIVSVVHTRISLASTNKILFDIKGDPNDFGLEIDIVR